MIREYWQMIVTDDGNQFLEDLHELTSVGYKLKHANYCPETLNHNYGAGEFKDPTGETRTFFALLRARFPPGKAPLEKGFGRPCRHGKDTIACDSCGFGHAPLPRLRDK